MEIIIGDERNEAENVSEPEEPEKMNPKKTEAEPKENKECWYFMNRKCKFEGKCREKYPTLCPAKLENGKCSNKSCNLAHP